MVPLPEVGKTKEGKKLRYKKRRNMFSLFNVLILMCLGDIQAKISDRLKSFQKRFLVKKKGVAKFLLFFTPLNSAKNKQTKKSKNSLSSMKPGKGHNHRPQTRKRICQVPEV